MTERKIRVEDGEEKKIEEEKQGEGRFGIGREKRKGEDERKGRK